MKFVFSLVVAFAFFHVSPAKAEKTEIACTNEAALKCMGPDLQSGTYFQDEDGDGKVTCYCLTGDDR